MSDRLAIARIGAAFSCDEDGTLLFTFVSDGSSVVGPRPATDQDRERFPHELAAFEAAQPPQSADGEGTPPAGVVLNVNEPVAAPEIEGLSAEALAAVEAAVAKGKAKA